MGEQVVIPVAHDFTCPWCWVALFQAKRLVREFGVEIDWRGYELWPEELEWPAPPGPQSKNPNRPPVPSRLDFLLMMDGVSVPEADRPKRMRVHASLEAVEFVKDHAPGSVGTFVESVYRAYWERGERIGDIEVTVRLAEPFVDDTRALRADLETRAYRDRVVHFDVPSYKAGIFNVPTFWIGGNRYAEQPYEVLRNALLESRGDISAAERALEVYRDLDFPLAPDHRPYVFINMVATIDGKILSGERDEPVVDLGSKTDHALMKRIEASADAVMVGAQTLRAAKKSWNPGSPIRIVVTRSGDLPWDSCFFAGKSIVASPGAPDSSDDGVERLGFKDVGDLLARLKARGLRKLLVMGGSSLNAQLFEAGLVDEIFLTITPKIRLGRDVPTIADGNALPRQSIQNYLIVEERRIGDELFVRYRRNS